MLYRKNLSKLERAVRGLGGGAMIAAGALPWGSQPGWILIASGVVMIATGWIGFCPACAMVGRRAVE